MHRLPSSLTLVVLRSLALLSALQLFLLLFSLVFLSYYFRSGTSLAPLRYEVVIPATPDELKVAGERKLAHDKKLAAERREEARAARAARRLAREARRQERERLRAIESEAVGLLPKLQVSFLEAAFQAH